MPEPGASGTATSDGEANRPGADPDLPADQTSARTRGWRRRSRLLIAASVGAACLASGAAAFGMSMHSPLPIAEVAITGVSADLRPQVESALGIAAGDSFSTVDSGAVAQRIAQIEGLNGADLRWTWWSTLSVDVDEQTPMGVAGAPGGGFRVLDAEAGTIRTVPERPAGLVLIEATGTAGLTAGLQIAAQLTDGLRPSTEAIVVDRSGRATLRTTSGATVILGEASNLPAKLALADQLLPATGAAVVNVSVPERPAVSGLPPDADS